MRAGLWLYENRPFAPIELFFDGTLTVEERNGGLSIELTDVRKHPASTHFGRRPPVEGEGTTWTPAEPIRYDGLRVVRKTDRLIYTETEDQVFKVVIDLNPPT